MGNLFLITVVVMLIWLTVSAFLLFKSGGNKKSRNAGGFMLFGPLWLVLEKDLSRKMSQRELIDWGVVVFLMFIGLALSVSDVL
jgi:uncharacterized membrane protein